MRSRPDRTARFWDRVAERYARRPVPDEAIYQTKLERTRARLRPDMQILELGCGTGTTALHHAPHVAHVLATDISAKMIEIARHKASDQGVTNVDFQVASLETLGAGNDRFDAILALNLLHLFPDWRSAICQIHSLLEPGGVFVSSTMCLGDSALRVFRWIAPIGEAVGLLPSLRVFTATELLAAHRAAGFGIDDDWRPGPNRAVFLIARKAGATTEGDGS
ncbi:MAG: class I SAM-dependent methyltransferase [Rhodocyclaceae bacterium]|nr:class I SAM-dependent methyltransferase [Rhodocyclaceae bacterium]